MESDTQAICPGHGCRRRRRGIQRPGVRSHTGQGPRQGAEDQSRQGDDHDLSLLRGGLRGHRAHQPKEGRVINIEGDPDHVINRGALCSKGASLCQLVENKQRLTRPMYRAPGAKDGRRCPGTGPLKKSPNGSRPRAMPPSWPRTPRARSSTAPTPSPMWAAPPWTTKSARPTRKCCGRWGWCISNTRPVSDTAQLLRLWQSRSDAVQ